MPGLLCVIDNLEQSGLTHTYNYLSSRYNTQLINFTNCNLNHFAADEQEMLSLYDKIKPEAVLTNSLAAVPSLYNKAKDKLILWAVDFDGNTCLERNDNVSLWRLIAGSLRTVNSFYAGSHYLARQITASFRIPCRVQYPYIPPQETSKPSIVFYNDRPIYLDRMIDFAPHLSYKRLNNYSDFASAISYIHSTIKTEYCNISIPIAASYGVPSIVEDVGCLAEFATNGDKVIPHCAPEKMWTEAFKTAIRDHTINAELVRKMSQRYNQMSEIEERIKAALYKNSGRPTHPANLRAFKEKKDQITRDNTLAAVHKQIVITPIGSKSSNPTNEIAAVKEYVNTHDHIYFGCGGLGDALLLIASCYYDPSPHVIFGAGHGAVKKLFDACKIPVLSVSNLFIRPTGIGILQYITNHAHFRGSAHLPPDLNYQKWTTDSEEYLTRFEKHLPLKEMFGRLVNPRVTKEVIGLAPRGSDHVGSFIQRFLSIPEFNQLVQKLLLRDTTVIAFGSEDDVNYYGVPSNNNFIWITGQFGISHPAPRYPCNFKYMLSAVNACDHIYSVDTWLKNYGSLAGIPTSVILSRRNGRSIYPPVYPSDYIFMNRDFWGFNFIEVDQLIANI